jgi:NitT/TauT family transport system ATP-binding protein
VTQSFADRIARAAPALAGAIFVAGLALAAAVALMLMRFNDTLRQTKAENLAERVVVLSRGPGQAVATFETGAPAPRPRGWRAEAPFRTTVEAVTDALAQHAGPQR